MLEEKMFIGSKEVKEFIVHEEVNNVGVLFVDDTEMNLTVSQWEALKASEPYSNNEVTGRKFAKAIRAVKEAILLEDVPTASDKILDIFIDERATISDYSWILKRIEQDIQPVVQRVETTLNNAFRRVVGKKFDVVDSAMILVSQLHQELLEIEKPEEQEMASGGEKH